MDRISEERRSWNMSRIRGKNTKPEMLVRSLIHRAGFRFTLHSSKLPGKPDILLPKYQTVIFVHGCFWHRHKGCKFAYTPKSNLEFWEAKFEANVRKDYEVKAQLEEMGWKHFTVWECQLNTPDNMEDFLTMFTCFVQKDVQL